MPVSGSTLRAAARSLAADLAAAEAVAALRAAGVRSIVLKGPALARVLYGRELRSYGDVDLLVAPGSEGAATAVLTGLGFTPVVTEDELAGHRPLHAHEWWREADHASVDLHRTLSGAGAAPGAVWDALSDATETARVGGTEVEILAPPALALQVALHAAHHGPAAKPLADLARAVERLPEETWAAAAALAVRIDATPALGAGLRLLPAGASLAERLRLGGEVPVAVALRAAGAPPLALGLDWLARTPGLRAKAALVAGTVVPPPGALRAWRPLARRRTLGLVAAYASHPFWLARHAVPSLAALRRARKEAG